MHRFYDVRTVSRWIDAADPVRMVRIWIVDRVILRWWERSIAGDLFVCRMSDLLEWGSDVLNTELGRCARIARAWNAHRLACFLGGLTEDCPWMIAAGKMEDMDEWGLAAELVQLYDNRQPVGLRIRPELPPVQNGFYSPLEDAWRRRKW